MAHIFVGTSGWHYDHWVGPFYPQSMKPKEFIRFYGEHFRAVEINNTFYNLPSKKTLADWRDSSPPGMVFACKASRYITHMKKLKDPKESTVRFFDAIETLGEKAGPVLFQLPPRWHADVERLRAFLEALPAGYRYTFEFRDGNWCRRQVYDLLRDHNAALCAYDLEGRRSRLKFTSDFAYVRLHGPDGAYRGSYDGRTLSGWVRRFLGWRDEGRDVYCFFNNDQNGYAARNALQMQEMIEKH